MQSKTTFSKGIKVNLLFLIITFCSPFFAQDRIEEFTILMPEQKVSGSLYRTVSVLDSREDTVSFGIVQVGAFNKPASLVALIPLSKQLTNVLANTIGSDAGNGELLMNLCRFSVSEISSSRSEVGECAFRATLYVKTSNGYQKIRRMDTLLNVGSSMGDVTKPLIKAAAGMPSNFLKSCLLSKLNDGTVYSRIDIAHEDSLEKLKIPAFSNPVLADGLYRSVRSFLDQKPDFDVVLDLKDDNVLAVRIKKNGSTQVVESQDVYAVVDHGRAFVSTEFGYYPLTRIDDNWVFVGPAKVTTSVGRMMLSGATAAVTGPFGARSDAQSSTFEMKIDHINGSFVKMKEIKMK